MARNIVLALTLVAGTGGAVLAQSQEVPREALPQNGGAGIRSDHITATGATVPNPGASQSAGTTSLDRGIQARDNEIESSICKGC